MQTKNATEEKKRWDFSIFHVDEDKEEIARPLAGALQARGLMVCYLDYALRLGDNLRESIDSGLSLSRFGIVVLSGRFFQRKWPQEELNTLATREMGRTKAILFIWDKVGFRDVFKYSPVLADRVAISTEKGLEYVVQRILEAAK